MVPGTTRRQHLINDFTGSGNRSRMIQAVQPLTRMLLQIRCLPPKASQENGDYPACTIYLHILWQEHREATLGWDLEVQRVQKDRGGRCLDSLVSLNHDQDFRSHSLLYRKQSQPTTTVELTYSYSTPAAAATRSTIRRLREIAEV